MEVQQFEFFYGKYNPLITNNQFFLGQSVHGEEAAMRLSLCEAANPNNKIRPHHRELRSLLFTKGVRVL